jgi:hypothetical protein
MSEGFRGSLMVRLWTVEQAAALLSDASHLTDVAA